MYLAIILLPLLGSISSGFFGRKIGVSGSQLITTSCVVLITIFSIISFFEVGFNNISVTIQLFKWIDSESLNVLWAFNFDSLTVSMLIPVLTVSSLVHIYSIGYMSHDPHNQRFFSYLSLFTFMMVILVTANNFLLMFVGWEGVGLCSYLLVSFWFTRIAANQSSISALLTNRVGDCFLTIGMFAILWSFGNIDYSTVFSLAPYISENIVTLIGICLLIGAMAKSSQVGLHVWLPMAMEGPTPVSALIHAATMVTAGVYLLMRSSPLIEYSSTVLMLALWIGAFTTVFSSLVGLFQQDIKKVIAYSTMSQLGMMVIAVGLSSYNIALFHLINHAFYKALLFLGAGSVIHAVADNQDFRKYGGLKPFLPLTYSVMLIASLSLVAFPFMTGFYSKDFILESAYGQFSFFSVAVYFIATIGAMFTTLYTVKVLYITFLSNPNGPIANYKMADEGDIFMSLPLIILAIFSIFFGYITKDIFIGLGSGFFADNGLFIHPNNEILVDTEFAVPTIFKILPFLLTIFLGVISFIFSEYYYKLILSFKLSRFGYNLFSFFNQRFYIELFYNTYITDLLLKLGGQTTKVLDKGSIELIGPFGLEKGLVYLSNTTKKLDTGAITNYALYILVGMVAYTTLPFVFNNLLVLMLVGLLNLSLNLELTSKNANNFINLQSNFNLLFKIKKSFNLKCVVIRLIASAIVSLAFSQLLFFFFALLGIGFFSVFVAGTSSVLTLLIISNFNSNKIIGPFQLLFCFLIGALICYAKFYMINCEILNNLVTISVFFQMCSNYVYSLIDFFKMPVIKEFALAGGRTAVFTKGSSGQSSQNTSTIGPPLYKSLWGYSSQIYNKLRSEGYTVEEADRAANWYRWDKLQPELYPGNDQAAGGYDPAASKRLLNSLGLNILKWGQKLRVKDTSPEQQAFLVDFFKKTGVNTKALEHKDGSINFAKLGMLDVNTLKFMIKKD